MTFAYYNDNEPAVAAWLRNLVAAGLLPPGDVDGRNIRDVQSTDLAGYTQVHLFAGIGGWPLALALAGWPATRPVWTGSCPCQPYSSAGAGAGDDDPRNLWPEFRRLIAECRPATVFGEQVASKDGRRWLDGVRADLEALGYAVGAADLCAASVGAPHIRQRLWWVADAGGTGRQQESRSASSHARPLAGRGQNNDHIATGHGSDSRLDDPASDGARRSRATKPGRNRADDGLPRATGSWSDYELVACADGKARRVESTLAFLDDGLSCILGSILPEVNHTQSQRARPHQALGAVWDANGADEVSKRATREFARLQKASLLQPPMHGPGDGGHNQGAQRAQQLPTVRQAGQRNLRELWAERYQTARASSQWAADGQPAIQLEDALRLMPQACAHAAFRQDPATVAALYLLFPPRAAPWPVQHSLLAMAQAWERPSNEAVERAWNASLLREAVRIPVAPLAARVPGDLVKLRAYGNAIVPPLAAEFVMAYMDWTA